MAIKYKNGREAKLDDAVVGIDWRGGIVTGKVVKGDVAKGHDALVFQHDTYGTVCPSLTLNNFVHADDAIVKRDGVPSVEAKPVSAIAEA